MAKKECCSLKCILDINDITSAEHDLSTKHTLLSEVSVLTNKNETNLELLYYQHCLAGQRTLGGYGVEESPVTPCHKFQLLSDQPLDRVD